MFGLLGGLLGGGMRAAAGRAVAGRPILSGLMSRRTGGSGSGGSVSGSSSPGPSDQPTTVKQESQPVTPPPAAEKPETPPQAESKPIVQEVSAGFQERPTLQDQQPQPTNPTTPVRPLEGLLDTQPSPPPPQAVAGTKIDAPQSVVAPGDGPQATAPPAGDTFPNSPEIAQPFLAAKTSQLPPRTTFIAPDANPSKPIDTSTKVNNSSPGYSTLGMTTPAAAAPQFSYLRR